MAAFLDVCRFTPTAGGTTDWTYAVAVTGYQSPAAAGVVNGRLYKYRAESADLSQWELGEGAYNTGTGVLARTTVLFNSSGTTSKINFSTVPQVAIVALKEDLISIEEANSFTTAQQAQARSNLGVPGANLIINGDFRINQRVYVSAATLAAGAYAHDRWKAGASGGDYSFTQLKSSTQITIAANKTLVQVVEDRNIVGGSFVLSWSGTCQARVGVNSATPSGSYASSPIPITGQTAGTVMSVEFGNGAASGTLGTVKLELGATATPFVMPDFETELVKCLRYFEKSYDYGTAPGTATQAGMFANYLQQGGSGVTTVIMGASVFFKAPKIAAPTVTLYNTVNGTSGQISDVYGGTNPACSAGNIGLNGFTYSVTVGANNGLFAQGHYKAESEL